MSNLFVSAASVFVQIFIIMLPGGGIAVVGYQIIRWWRNKRAPVRQSSERPA